MARRKAVKRKGKGFGIERMSDDIMIAATNALRNAAKDVLNDLAAEGPNWGGNFRNDWYVETSDGKRGTQTSGADGKYNLWNIPLLTQQGRNTRGQFTRAMPINRNKIELLIGNSSSYATQAMDLEPGGFIYPGFEPAGEEQPRGLRKDGIRGKLKPPGGNRSTAPLNWYTTYMEGGAFTAAFNKGAKAGFLVPANRPRFSRPA